MPSITKEKNFRCKRLLQLAELAPHCMYCRELQRGQVVACHSNAIKHGHGAGIKAHDIPAYLCKRCHDIFDGRIGANATTKQEMELIFYEGVYNTFLWLLREQHMEVK